jgi:probable 2-oxoglutarate dehydrogenase E1 component DHKTD1
VPQHRRFELPTDCSPVSALDPYRYGLDDTTSYPLNGILHLPQSPATRREAGEGTDASLPLPVIRDHLMNVYVDRIGYEFQHCPDKHERLWFSHHLETQTASGALAEGVSDERKKRLWELLSRSEEFDRFMGKKFPNLKRYGMSQRVQEGAWTDGYRMRGC